MQMLLSDASRSRGAVVGAAAESANKRKALSAAIRAPGDFLTWNSMSHFAGRSRCTSPASLARLLFRPAAWPNGSDKRRRPDRPCGRRRLSSCSPTSGDSHRPAQLRCRLRAWRPFPLDQNFSRPLLTHSSHSASPEARSGSDGCDDAPRRRLPLAIRLPHLFVLKSIFNRRPNHSEVSPRLHLLLAPTGSADAREAIRRIWPLAATSGQSLRREWASQAGGPPSLF